MTSATGTGEEADCVIAAREAAQVFSDEMRSFSKPPIDVNAWDRTYLRIENRIAAADDKCDVLAAGLLDRRRARWAICASSATTSPAPRAATARRRSTPRRRWAASTTRSTSRRSSRAGCATSRGRLAPSAGVPGRGSGGFSEPSRRPTRVGVRLHSTLRPQHQRAVSRSPSPTDARRARPHR